MSGLTDADLVLSHPGQCCDGWCVESAGLHHLDREDAERVVAFVTRAVNEALTQAADAIVMETHETAHAEVCRTQYRSDKTSAHVALDVAADWIRARTT